MRKAEMITAARKAITSNLFRIFNFYDQLKKIYEKNLDLDESNIFNCDKTGFPAIQRRGKVISVKGERAFKLFFCARRETITVLSVCSANRVTLDPLIIFKGYILCQFGVETSSSPQIHIMVNQRMDEWAQKHSQNK